jgi:NADH-quinone oxidoreductase subunit H
LPDWLAYGLAGLIGIVAILTFVLVLVMVFIYLERRGIGRFQIRRGPNRVGPWGILQPIADALKVLTKEDIIPASGDKWVHWLAPVVAFVPALMVFAVVPFARTAILADLNIGILYIVAITSVTVMGVFMAGWGSSNKYSLISAMRTVAQMVSYEVPLVLSILGVVLITGSLSMVSIVEAQEIPFIVLQPLGFLIFFLGATAELNRTPFDLLEAESEIIAGYHTEYSGMKFALFYLGEYAHTLGMAAIVTTLFLGGWKGPLLPPFLWFLIKVLLVFFLVIWIRSTLPRLRIDQLMGFAWKVLFPLAVINLLITGAEVIVGAEVVKWQDFPWYFLFLNLALTLGLIVLWSRSFFRLGGGRVEI